ncbi:hypothetical protein P3S67_003092 [Capsicum chacoense]
MLRRRKKTRELERIECVEDDEEEGRKGEENPYTKAMQFMSHVLVFEEHVIRNFLSIYREISMLIELGLEKLGRSLRKLVSSSPMGRCIAGKESKYQLRTKLSQWLGTTILCGDVATTLQWIKTRRWSQFKREVIAAV